MNSATHIIYIPGFGDSYDGIRRRLLSKWQFDDVTVELVPMNWKSDENLDQKIERINHAVDAARGKKIVIVGESASGSMAIHIYAAKQNDIYRAMTLCGKNAHPANVKPHYYKKYPAFRESMDRLDESTAKLTVEARQRFVSIHPIYDPVVTVSDTRLSECHEVTLPAVGHLFVIFLALTVWSRRIVTEALR